MWFGYDDDNNWHPVDVERVKEILELNKKGEKPSTLLEDKEEEVVQTSINSDLVAMDKKFSGEGNKKKKKKGNKFQGKKNHHPKKENS